MVQTINNKAHLLKSANLHLLKTTDVINITFVQNAKGVRPLYKTTYPYVHLYKTPNVLDICTFVQYICTKQQIYICTKRQQ